MIQTEVLPTERQEHIQANLFKVVCAILNVKAVERGTVPYLEQKLLDTYLEQIVSEQFLSD